MWYWPLKLKHYFQKSFQEAARLAQTAEEEAQRRRDEQERRDREIAARLQMEQVEEDTGPVQPKNMLVLLDKLYLTMNYILVLKIWRANDTTWLSGRTLNYVILSTRRPTSIWYKHVETSSRGVWLPTTIGDQRLDSAEKRKQFHSVFRLWSPRLSNWLWIKPIS